VSQRSGAAWGSLAAGAASFATLPLATYLTRFSDAYELLHAGFAIPLGAALGFLALALARRAKRQRNVLLGRAPRSGAATAGRALGAIGLCLAAAAVVALAVYGLLEYAGSRD
jgi:hypothetical protein